MAHTVAFGFLIILLACGLSNGFHGSSKTKSKKLLVLLLDGFRWDYTSKTRLENFEFLKKTGAYARYLTSAYPTLSYPNYYTLMTGLYTESHGMTGNYMFYREIGELFLIGRNPEKFNSHWWDGAEPLWVTAVKRNKKAYMYYWPGCDVTIRGTRPTYCEPYTEVLSLDHLAYSLQTAVDKLTQKDGADVAFVYYEDPDKTGHWFGPDSAELISVLEGIDAKMGILLNRLKGLPKKNKVNLLVMSDHGMTNVSPGRIINITDALLEDPSFILAVEAGSIVSIYTADQKSTEKVYGQLNEFHPNMKVYRKDQIPKRYHYRNGRFVGDITCVADNGWFILHPNYTQYPVMMGQELKGYHGYDNLEQDMRGIFYAYGPYFKKGVNVPSLHAVDPYILMCDILNIDSAPNNGSRNAWKNLVKKLGPVY